MQTNSKTESEPAVRCDDLLPCPFCGCELPDVDSGWIMGWEISCGGCGANPTGTVRCDTYEKAAERWNHRHGNDQALRLADASQSATKKEKP